MVEILDLIEKMYDAIFDLKVSEIWVSEISPFLNAFDTNNFDILLDQLCHYGIRGLALNWLCDDLHNSQFVKINNDYNSQ